MINFFKKIMFCQFNFRKKKKPLGKTIDGKKVYRCEQTQLLYYFGEPTKQYVNLKDVIFKNEK